MRSILAAILLVAFLTAPLSAQELTGTLLQIQKSGKIKIGFRQSQPPMSFLDKDGTPAGYSIDLCKDIVTGIKKKIGGDVDIEYVPVTAVERFDALNDNKIDILCGATTKTLSRGELVDFTQLTFVTGASFMTLKTTQIMNNFDGKKIGVVKGTTTHVALKELFQDAEIKAEIVLVDTTAEGLNSMEKGKIDAISADQVVLIGLALDTGKPQNYSILPNLISYEPFALAVRRNDADFRLVADRVISQLYRTKQIVPIYNKWFGQFSSQMPTAFEAVIAINATPE
ncbi:amino acid ABC transporter substrate-binding protein [Thermodesulfobacteriota bacterium]